MSGPRLRLKNVSKNYLLGSGQTFQALTGVTLDIASQEFLSFIGPSGCGKTTLLKIAAGLLTESTGNVAFGENGSGVPREQMGFVFQEPNLLPWLTVEKNILLPVRIRGRVAQDHIERCHELLGQLRLGKNAKSYPHELSGGMKQRVAIIRAILHEPAVLFMDEPFGALDALTRDELNMDLQKIHQSQGASVLFVTHSIDEAVLLSDRIAVMGTGPGRIAEIVDVNIKRPRDFTTTMDEEFRRLSVHIRETLDSVSRHTLESNPDRQ